MIIYTPHPLDKIKKFKTLASFFKFKGRKTLVTRDGVEDLKIIVECREDKPWYYIVSKVKNKWIKTYTSPSFEGVYGEFNRWLDTPEYIYSTIFDIKTKRP